MKNMHKHWSWTEERLVTFYFPDYNKQVILEGNKCSCFVLAEQGVLRRLRYMMTCFFYYKMKKGDRKTQFPPENGKITCS